MRALISGFAVTALLTLGAQKSTTGDANKGKAVFEQCATCHNPASAEKKIGPGLKGLFKKAKMQNGRRPTEQNVRAVIESGGGGMPAFREMLTEQEKTDLIAYLRTL
jgi:cytochrome c